MEFLFDLPLIGPFFSVILPFLLVLGIVIFVHEYGHYIVGRWAGIHAEVFSIGFGPEVVGWTDARGTRWKVCWIPLGGYVKFLGDADAASNPDREALEGMSVEERRRSLQGAPLWAQASMVAAGPIANFLLTILLITGLALYQGKVSDAPVIAEATPTGQAYGGGLRAGDRVISVDGQSVESLGAFQTAMLAEEGRPREVEIERDGRRETLEFAFSTPTLVRSVTPGGAAAAACIAPGDVIQKVNGEPIGSFSQLREAVTTSGGAPLQLTVQRGSELKELEITPRLSEQHDPATNTVQRRLLIGVSTDLNIGVTAEREAVGVGEAFMIGLGAPVRVASATFGYLGAIFAGDADGSSLGGPIGIADASGRAAEAGLVQFIAFIATISSAIGLLNLFPIPILDGGRLVFYAIEGVLGRPVGERWMDAAMTAGLAAVLALLVFATSNDVTRLASGLTANC